MFFILLSTVNSSCKVDHWLNSRASVGGTKKEVFPSASEQRMCKSSCFLSCISPTGPQLSGLRTNIWPKVKLRASQQPITRSGSRILLKSRCYTLFYRIWKYWERGKTWINCTFILNYFSSTLHNSSLQRSICSGPTLFSWTKQAHGRNSFIFS